ncbi:MAG TPA: TonB-dependent receptor [Gammaproteobacteria bacterium]|nr:TonB-dependent receptor [Gammaproteobacteria bacterium]
MSSLTRAHCILLALAALGPVRFTAAQTPPADQAVIEEIVVVAQKREQLVQDLGISVTAFSGRSLRERGVDQPEDLPQLIPNVNLQNNGGGGAPVVILRGVGLQSFRINDSPTTAFYVDDVYQTSVASAEWTMFDLERVEVLKGPQGGLYGRNAIGGAIQIISRAPDPEEGGDGYVALGFGEYSKRELEGAATFALSDTTAVRVAGRWLESSDSPYASVTGGFKQGAEDRGAARVSLRMAPNDNIDLVLRVHGGSDDSELEPLRSVGIYANIGNAAVFNAPNVSLALLAGLRGQLAAPLCASVASGRGSDPASCATVTGVTPATYGLTNDNPYASVSAFRGFQRSDWTGAAFSAAFNLGDYRLQSITARDSIDYRRFADFDATPAEHLHIDYNTQIDAWSEELRLFYEGSDTVNWVVGLSYAEDELTENSPLYGRQGVLPLLFSGAVFSPQNYDQDTNAFAVYGHAEWRFSQPWNLVGELRYTDEEKSFVGGARLGFANGVTVPFLATDDETSFDAISGKLGLEWTLNEDLLAFAAISRGFKTGGFYGGFPTSLAQLAPFDEETLWALEVGVKSDWRDGRLRLNASLFHYDRENVQQNAADPASSISIKRITNIGDVDTVGAEADLIWLASDRLSVSLGIGTTDAEVSDSAFIQAASLPLLPDAPMEGSNIPNYSARSLSFVGRYDAPLGNDLEYFIQLEGRYQSEQDLSIITHPIEEAIFTEPGYSLWNLRFGLGGAAQRWQAQVFVNNLTDETYRVLARNDGAFGIYELYGLPRTWGVNYQYRWD